MSVVTKSFSFFILVWVFIVLSGCSSTVKNEEYKGVYKETKTREYSLEVPPDLVTPDSSNALRIPSLTTAGSSFSEYSSLDSTGNVLPASTAGVRFVRDGSVFWLEIKAKPDEVWNQVRNFFQDLGFTFTTESPVNGLLETAYLENRFDVPTGWFASMLGGLFSTGLMDRYRIRIERTDKDDVIRLFITHQGLKEQSYGSWSESDYSVKWVEREPDPELEAEMLQRFLVFRGVSKARAKQIVSVGNTRERAKLVKNTQSGHYELEINEIFPRTWRRISIALDRMGLVVEDRNRSKGLYYIKTTEDFIKGDTEEKGWFASLFSSSNEQLKIAEFQLSVDDLEDKTVIKILNTDGQPDKSKTAYFILEKLKVHLR